MNHELQAELEQMKEADQSLRMEAMGIAREHGRSSPEYQAMRDRGVESDHRNVARLIAIVAEHGWPGISMVGETAASGALLILQHADIDIQKMFVPAVRESAASNDLPAGLLPLLEDRLLLYEGKEQIYGTQITRSADGSPTLWPIADEEHVEARRARVGLEPLSTYLKRFGMEYNHEGK